MRQRESRSVVVKRSQTQTGQGEVREEAIHRWLLPALRSTGGLGLATQSRLS
jgi:hypothetical protein